MDLGNDLGSERDLRDPRPCCRRIRKDHKVGWCLLDDGHAGDCSAELAAEPRPTEGVLREIGQSHYGPPNK